MDKAVENQEQVMTRLKEVSREGMISCSAARQVAEEMQFPMRLIGPLCDQLKLKIKGCELGCF